MLIVHIHYSHDMTLFDVLVIEKEKETTTERKIFGKISPCKCLKDRRSELEGMIKDVN